MTTKTTYCAERLKALGVTDEYNHLVGITDNDDHQCPDWLMFTPDKDDNIVIHYTTPWGEKIMYDNGNKNNSDRDFIRKRLKSPKGDMKYTQPEGSPVYPFSTPTIIETYVQEKKVKTLYIVEGEFKAVSLSLLGLPTFAIPGITSYKEKGKNELHYYIQDYIRRCKVENIVLIFDADYKQIRWEEGKDLAKRLKSFYNALLKFKEFCKPLDIDLYFSPVKPTSTDKGIDDVLCNSNTDKEILKKEISSLLVGTERKYIETYLISGNSANYVQKIFNLDYGEGLQRLYDENIDQLQNKEFVFNGKSYYADSNGKVQCSYNGAIKQFIRVGDDFYQKVCDERAGVYETYLRPIKRCTITEDYGNKIIKNIPRYHDFGNMPDNTESYQQSYITKYGDCETIHYNIYSAMTHTPKEGSWSTIDKLFHHIFDYPNVKGVDLYNFGLDYVQLLYQQPQKHLPILCLVSKERGTGKTTFLNLLRNIFTSNMVITDSDRISSQFSGSWAGKLVVAVDESRIAVDKPLVTERLKMIATNDTIVYEKKGKDAQQITNYTKLIMCSNEVSNFVKIDDEENRYAVINVKPIAENCDFNMQKKMIAEIPAFLYMLQNRKMHYEEASRLYFDSRDYETEALNLIKLRTQNTIIRTIQDVISDQFFRQERMTIKLSREAVYRLVSAVYKYKNLNLQNISDFLHDKGLKTGNPTSFNYIDENGTSISVSKQKAYTLFAGDWLGANEYADLKKMLSDDAEQEELPY